MMLLVLLQCGLFKQREFRTVLFAIMLFRPRIGTSTSDREQADATTRGDIMEQMAAEMAFIHSTRPQLELRSSFIWIHFFLLMRWINIDECEMHTRAQTHITSHFRVKNILYIGIWIIACIFLYASAATFTP